MDAKPKAGGGEWPPQWKAPANYNKYATECERIDARVS
jgi:hypothetical protein